jgi:acyl dehydratase
MGRPTVIPALAAIADYVGVELGTTDWVPITQERIDAFANATGDHQWIHTDVERARRESPFEETVAHGYLTLALAPALLPQILRIDGWKTAINSGIEKMRLSSPVLAGARVRMSALIKHSRNLPRGGVRVVIHLEFEVEGSEKPACVADVIYVYFPSA